MDYTPQLCQSCREKAKTVDIEYITTIIDRLHEEAYPEMEDDVLRKSILKRGLDDCEHGKNAKNAKNASV